MIEHNYEKGYKTLKLIKTNNFKPDQAKDYEAMNFYFSYFLGKIDTQTIQENLNRRYWIFRLLCDSEQALLKRVNYHKENNKNPMPSYFLNSINLKKLLEEVREKISILNPDSFKLIDRYKFRMDKPIGYEDNQLTYDICVETILGTNKILTMYPVLLSDEFDREGNGTNERIRKKRELNRKSSK